MIIKQQQKTERNEMSDERRDKKMEQIRMSRLWFGASLAAMLLVACLVLVCLCGVKNYQDAY